MNDWHFNVAGINGVLHVSSRITDRRSADFVIANLLMLKRFLRKPVRNPLVPEIWKWARAFK